MRPGRLGHQHAVEIGAVRILDRQREKLRGQVIGGHVSRAFLPNLPAEPAINLDLDLRHCQGLSGG